MKIPTITPRNEQVLIKPDEKSSKVSKYGIVRTDKSEDDEKAYGTVLAVGSKVEDIKEGDRVVYTQFGGEEITFTDAEGNEESLQITHEDQILAFLS